MENELLKLKLRWITANGDEEKKKASDAILEFLRKTKTNKP